MSQVDQKMPTTDARGQRRPARKADCAGPLEEHFRKEKTKESGRICKRLCKGLDEVVLHAGSPFGDGGFNRSAQAAGPGCVMQAMKNQPTSGLGETGMGSGSVQAAHARAIE